MNPEHILEMLNELRALPYFPNDEYVMNALVRLCGSMCDTEDQVRWLVNRMTSGIYSKWPGVREMRACYVSRFKPKDGINATSEVYLDGLPTDPTARPRIEAPQLLALPEGHTVSADPQAEAAVKIAVELIKLKSLPFNAPVSQAEIDAAPEWLRRLEGYAE